METCYDETENSFGRFSGKKTLPNFTYYIIRNADLLNMGQFIQRTFPSAGIIKALEIFGVLPLISGNFQPSEKHINSVFRSRTYFWCIKSFLCRGFWNTNEIFITMRTIYNNSHTQN